MSNLRRAGGTLLTGLALLGCGSETDSPATFGTNAVVGGTSGVSSSVGNSGAAIKGGASSGGSSSGSPSTGATGGGATGAEGYIGTVQVIRTVTGAGSTLSSASFDYVEQAAWDARASGEPCPEETYGACVVTKCPVRPETEPNPDGLPSSDHLDAGTITMTADAGNFSRTGTPTKVDHGYTFDSTGSLSGQELVTISATGGTVSSFISKIQMPLTPLLLVPSLEGLQGAVDVPVSRTADFTFSWDTRGASQRLQLVVTAPSSSTTGLRSMTCQLDPAAGTSTFQVGALSQLPAGTKIRLFGVQSVNVETPEGTVGLLAAFEMISADKASYPTFVLE